MWFVNLTLFCFKFVHLFNVVNILFVLLRDLRFALVQFCGSKEIPK